MWAIASSYLTRRIWWKRYEGRQRGANGLLKSNRKKLWLFGCYWVEVRKGRNNLYKIYPLSSLINKTFIKLESLERKIKAIGIQERLDIYINPRKIWLQQPFLCQVFQNDYLTQKLLPLLSRKLSFSTDQYFLLMGPTYALPFPPLPSLHFPLKFPIDEQRIPLSINCVLILHKWLRGFNLVQMFSN